MKLQLNSGWSYCSEQILEFEKDLESGDSIKILELGAAILSNKRKQT